MHYSSHMIAVSTWSHVHMKVLNDRENHKCHHSRGTTSHMSDSSARLLKTTIYASIEDFTMSDSIGSDCWNSN